ncbi:MAG: alpha/beta fold hydrolase [Candidatus Berkiella sp.]
MAYYILVHGAWHGAWCWEKVAFMLKQRGHSVIAPDLPGHGNDKTQASNIHLQDYINCIEALVSRAPQEVILVGHSFAGMVISAVNSEKVKQLIYVAGFLPMHGQSLHDITANIPPSRFIKMMGIDTQNMLLHANVNAMKDYAYQTCENGVFESISSLFSPEPMAPFGEKVHLSENRFSLLPKVYIECLQDKMISIQTQRQMQQTTACEVYSLDCDHSPFYSAASGLAEILLSLAS